MSREVTAALGINQRFPRVSGDEPRSIAASAHRAAFSPRERG